MIDEIRAVGDLAAAAREALANEQTARINDGRRLLDGREAMEAFCLSVLQGELDKIDRDRLGRGMERLNADEEDNLIQLALDLVVGLGPIERLLVDPNVEEIVATRWNLVFVYRSDGSCEQIRDVMWSSNADLEGWVRHLAATVGRTERRFDGAAPLLVMRLGPGLRLAATREVSENVSFALRRNTLGKVTLPDLVDRKMMPPAICELLAACMRSTEMRMVFAGATGSGKTTLARAVLSELDRLARLVIIEDTGELDMFDADDRPNVEEWEAREENIEGEGEISAGQLVKHALRYRPDWLTVGEVRDSDAAVPMIKAMTHGQSSLTTVHAASATGALDKLALYLSTGEDRLPIEAAHFQLWQAVDFVVYLDRQRDGRRVVREVAEISSYDNGRCLTNTIYNVSEGTHQRLTEQHRERLARAGFNESVLESWWAVS